MRPRTSNEKMLLAVLVLIAFVGGNISAYKWFAGKRAAMRTTEETLQGEQSDAQLALQESETWKQRRAWINDHQPLLGDEGDAKAAVLTVVQKGARANKLEITDQNINDVSRLAGGTRVNVSVKVKGSMEDLVKWLTALEKPDDFYAVTLFSLKADPDQKSFDCTVQVSRYFKGGAT